MKSAWFHAAMHICELSIFLNAVLDETKQIIRVINFMAYSIYWFCAEEEWKQKIIVAAASPEKLQMCEFNICDNLQLAIFSHFY